MCSVSLKRKPGVNIRLMKYRQYLYYNSSYWMTLEPLMAHFPTRSISGAMKCYYLIQYAYWLQQLVIVNIEERRKDHWQMFSHHVITAALLLGSYSFYLTKAGHVILILMDGVDILLCVSLAQAPTNEEFCCGALRKY